MAEPPKEVANRIARDGGILAEKEPTYRQNQNDSPKQTIHRCCCNSALRNAVFNIPGIFPGGDGALRRYVFSVCNLEDRKTKKRVSSRAAKTARDLPVASSITQLINARQSGIDAAWIAEAVTGLRSGKAFTPGRPSTIA